MVLRCIKGIWKYIKRVDILLWLIVAAISAYSLVLLRSVDSAVDGHARPMDCRKMNAPLFTQDSTVMDRNTRMANTANCV